MAGRVVPLVLAWLAAACSTNPQGNAEAPGGPSGGNGVSAGASSSGGGTAALGGGAGTGLSANVPRSRLSWNDAVTLGGSCGDSAPTGCGEAARQSTWGQAAQSFAKIAFSVLLGRNAADAFAASG